MLLVNPVNSTSKNTLQKQSYKCTKIILYHTIHVRVHTHAQTTKMTMLSNYYYVPGMVLRTS